MRSSHIGLLEMLTNELCFAGAPERALTPLIGLRIRALRRPAYWFNSAEYFQRVTNEALDAHKEVFELLRDAKLWQPASEPSLRASPFTPLRSFFSLCTRLSYGPRWPTTNSRTPQRWQGCTHP